MSIFNRWFSNASQREYNRGIVAFNRGDYEQAIESFRAVLDSASQGSTVYRLGRFYVTESLAKLGLACFLDRRYDEARDAFLQVLENNPHFPDIHCRLGEIAEFEGDFDEAESRYRRALEIHANYREPCAYLALLLRQSGRFSEAAEFFHRLKQSGMEVPEAWTRGEPGADDRQAVNRMRETVRSRGRSQEHYRIGLERYRAGDLDGARLAFQTAVRNAPEYPDLRCRLATVLGELGRFADAVRELDKALELNPGYVEARIKRAVAAMEIGRYESAIEDLRAVIRLEEPSLELRYLFGLALLKGGRVEESLQPLREASQHDALREPARDALARAYVALERPEQAVRCLERANSSECLALLGRVYLQMRRFEDAQRTLETVLESGAGGGDVLLALAHAELGLGRTEMARRRCEEALCHEEVAADASLLLGRLSFEAGDDAAALDWLRKASLTPRHDYSALVLMGRALGRLSRVEEATAALEKALEMRPGGMDAARALGLLLRRAGDAARGEKFLAAASRDPSDPLWGSQRPPKTGDAWRQAA